MQIKSLVNKDVQNITNCESEPIHIPGSIQPYGFLLGISPTDHTIHYCSENCEEYLNASVKEILGNNIAAFFNKEEIENFTKYFQSGTMEMSRPFVFLLKGIGYNCTTHTSGQYIILEFEPFTEDLFELPNLYIQSKRFTYFTEKADNLQSLCQDIADETRLIIGFDRVMIYRFDEQYNGEVFAESREAHLEPFLNLHYPHTDIPVQARELYLKNLVRMVADVNYIPVPLFTFEEEGKPAENLDLGISFLRSVSPIHIEYLKNMGVSATFVISVIHHNKLWGLISCHHYTPKNIPYYKRLAAHLQAILLTSQIDVRQTADRFEFVKQTDQKADALNNLLINEPNHIGEPATLQLLQTMLNADGILVVYRDQLFTNGIVPAENEIPLLIDWLMDVLQKEVFFTHKLNDHYPGAASLDTKVAGLCFMAFGSDLKNGIIWLRQEVKKTINWSGNPDKAIQQNNITQVLSPRKSFEKWLQLVEHQSAEWQKPELDAARTICATLQRQLHLADLKEEESRYLSLNDKLKKANENWPI
jgi:two-component system, chemotaxis family, sensor kinase Cph1